MREGLDIKLRNSVDKGWAEEGEITQKMHFYSVRRDLLCETERTEHFKKVPEASERTMTQQSQGGT